MIIKTRELGGAALDWAVAEAEGEQTRNIYGHIVPCFIPPFSTDWSQGGPLIDKYRSSLYLLDDGSYRCVLSGDGHSGREGPTPLIAAMRAIVAAELGDEVDVPEELLP